MNFFFKMSGFLVLFISCFLISCKDKKSTPEPGENGGDSPPKVEQGQGRDAAVSCKCAKGEEEPVSLDADSVQKAEETCVAKGEGYQIKSCAKKAAN